MNLFTENWRPALTTSSLPVLSGEGVEYQWWDEYRVEGSQGRSGRDKALSLKLPCYRPRPRGRYRSRFFGDELRPSSRPSFGCLLASPTHLLSTIKDR